MQQQKKCFDPQMVVSDLLIWKNYYDLLKRDAFDPDTRRIMHKTQIRDNP